MLGLVAEAAGHAAAARLDDVTASPGTCSSSARVAPSVSNAFWWQWPCSERARLRQRLAAQVARGRRGARASRNSSTRYARAASCDAASPRPITANSSRSDSRHDGSRPTIAAPRRDVRQQRVGETPRLRARLVAPARPSAACGRSTADAPRRSPRAQSPRDSRRRAARAASHGVLRLERVGERVDEQHDVGVRVVGRRVTQVGIAAPHRQRAPRADAGDALGQPRGARHAVAQVEQRGPTRGASAAQRGSVATIRSRSVRPCFACHAWRNSIFIRAMSTPVGTFAPAALAADAKVERIAHVGRREPAARAGPTARAATCWRGRASGASRRG